MSPYGTRPPVLARIPGVSSVASGHHHEEAPTSSGRLVNQAFSFKLLVACTVLLVAGAIVPRLFCRNASPEPTPTADGSPAWQPTNPAVPTEAEVASPYEIPKSPIAPPVMPSTYTSEVAVTASAPAPAEDPMMTPWPNPQPAVTSGVESADGDEPRSGLNQSMAIRPTEYIRNSHDSTRSGVH